MAFCFMTSLFPQTSYLPVTLSPCLLVILLPLFPAKIGLAKREFIYSFLERSALLLITISNINTVTKMMVDNGRNSGVSPPLRASA